MRFKTAHYIYDLPTQKTALLALYLQLAHILTTAVFLLLKASAVRPRPNSRLLRLPSRFAVYAGTACCDYSPRPLRTVTFALPRRLLRRPEPPTALLAAPPASAPAQLPTSLGLGY